MSRLEELLAELCPYGVNYTEIGTVMNYEQPTKYIVGNTDYNDTFSIPVLTAGQSFILGYTNEVDGIYKASKDNPVIIFDDFTGAFKWVDFQFKVKSSAMKMLTANAKKTTLRYLYHVMGNIDFTSDEHKRLWISTYSAIKIPLPPLPVQHEIVRILDNFTKLTAELTDRKRQYDYYREQLFNFKTQAVDYACLGDKNVGKFIRGSGLQKKDFTDTGVGCIHYGQIYTYYGTYTDKTKTYVSEAFAQKARKAKCGDLIVATTSENDEEVCKAVAWLGCEEIAVSSDACFYSHNMHPKYVAYFFQTDQFRKQKRPLITGTKVRRVGVDNLAKIKIPIPPLPEQQRIVDILDRFDTLCNDISKGLPAEIAERQKQYKYYRNKLLTFKNINAEV